jgi:ABC-type uncharacterized transport system substrate-binding protein
MTTIQAQLPRAEGLRPRLTKQGHPQFYGVERPFTRWATFMTEAARLAVDVLEVPTRSDFEAAFLTARQRGADAALLLSSPLISVNAQSLAELAIHHRLPAVTLFPDFARAGGLLAYGVDVLDMFRQTGIIVGKVLQGRKPAELPIERPTKFELVLNLGAAKRLGIEIPTSVLLRADEVIE